MRPAAMLVVTVSCLGLLIGCSRSNDAEVSKARVEADSVKAELARARAEAETARAELVKVRADLEAARRDAAGATVAVQAGDPAKKSDPQLVVSQEKQKSPDGEITFKDGRKEEFKILTGVRHMNAGTANVSGGFFTLFVPQPVPGELVFNRDVDRALVEIRIATDKVSTVIFETRVQIGPSVPMKVTITFKDKSEKQFLVNTGEGDHAIDILRSDGAITQRYNINTLDGATIRFSH